MINRISMFFLITVLVGASHIARPREEVLRSKGNAIATILN